MTDQKKLEDKNDSASEKGKQIHHALRPPTNIDHKKLARKRQLLIVMRSGNRAEFERLLKEAGFPGVAREEMLKQFDEYQRTS